MIMIVMMILVMMILVMMILVMMMTMVTRDLEKHIIAQSVNTGHDVSNIQFDLQVMMIINQNAGK